MPATKARGSRNPGSSQKAASGAQAQQLFSESMVLPRGAGLEVVSARLTVQGRDIVAVEPCSRAEHEARPDAAAVLDLGSRLVTPAFVNGHTHIAMAIFRGLSNAQVMMGNVVEDLYFRVEQFLSPEDIRAFARIGAYENLLSGVGAVWEHYYGNEALLEAFRDTGLAGVIAPTLQDCHGPGVSAVEESLAFTAALADDRSACSEGIVAALGPHATNTVSPRLWAQTLEVAERYQLPIHLHIAQSIEEVERCYAEHGCSPVTLLQRLGCLDAGPGVLLVHSLFVSRSDLAQLEPSRHVLGYCPFSQLQFDFPVHLESWLGAGLGFVVGTDCGACNDSMNVQQELRLMANGVAFATTYGPEHARFRESGSLAMAREVAAQRRRRLAQNIPWTQPETLLRSVWEVPGQIHPQLPLGRIAPGMVANLAVWDLDHPAFWPGRDPLRALVFGQISGALHGLMVAGRWIGERGNFHRSLLDSDAYRSACREASDRLTILKQRLGLS